MWMAALTLAVGSRQITWFARRFVFLISLQNQGRYEGQCLAHRIRPGKNELSAEGCLGKTRMA
jgi:hypothetical protein